MTEKDFNARKEIFSKVLRAGRRTYFFDVRETRAGDYYLTITESKRQNTEDGEFYYRKHKIYLYKEDFDKFKELLNEVTDFIIREKGPEVISERHRPDYDASARENAEETPDENVEEGNAEDENTPDAGSFSDVDFDDIK